MTVHHEKAPTGCLEALVEDYRYWLVTERSLAASTIKYYVAGARLFLSEVDQRDLKSLTLGEVTGFVVRHCPRLSVGSAKNLAASLRSLLGYLYLHGLTDRQLASAVPAPSGPHGGSCWRQRCLHMGRQWSLMTDRHTCLRTSARSDGGVVMVSLG